MATVADRRQAGHGGVPAVDGATRKGGAKTEDGQVKGELEYGLNKVGCQALITETTLKSSDYLSMLLSLAPELASFEKLSAQGLPIVCIAADEYGGTSDVLRKAEQLGLSMPILHVPREQISAMEELYDHAMLPATYVIDSLGEVREVFLGKISPEALLEEVRASLP